MQLLAADVCLLLRGAASRCCSEVCGVAVLGYTRRASAALGREHPQLSMRISNRGCPPS